MERVILMNGRISENFKGWMWLLAVLFLSAAFAQTTELRFKEGVIFNEFTRVAQFDTQFDKGILT